MYHLIGVRNEESQTWKQYNGDYNNGCSTWMGEKKTYNSEKIFLRLNNKKNMLPKRRTMIRLGIYGRDSCHKVKRQEEYSKVRKLL